MPRDVATQGRSVTCFLFLRYRAEPFEIGAGIPLPEVTADVPREQGMMIVISCPRSLTGNLVYSRCLERIWVKLFDLSRCPSASKPTSFEWLARCMTASS